MADETPSSGQAFLERCLAAAKDVDDIEISDPDRVQFLPVSDVECLLRVTDLAGDVESRVLKMPATRPSSRGTPTERTPTSQGLHN